MYSESSSGRKAGLRLVPGLLLIAASAACVGPSSLRGPTPVGPQTERNAETRQERDEPRESLPDAETRLRRALGLETDASRRQDLLASLAANLGAQRRHGEAAEVWWQMVDLCSRFPSETNRDNTVRETVHDELALRRAARNLAVSLRYDGRSREAASVYRQYVSPGAEAGDALPMFLFPESTDEARGETTEAAEVELILGEEVRIDTGGAAQAAELSLAAVGSEVVAAWNDLRQATVDQWRLGAAFSSDAGLTWTDGIVRPPGPIDNAFEGDPMTAADPRSGHLWVGAMDFTDQRGYVAHRNPNGSFDPPVLFSDTVGDKCWMAAGPDPGDPSDPLRTRLYVAYSFPEELRISTDLGESFPLTTNLPLGIGYLPRVASDGVLYILYSELTPEFFPGEMRLLRSFDGGLTFDEPIRVAERMDTWDFQDGSRVPGRFRIPALGNLAVDPNDGTLYVTWFDTTQVVDGESDLDLYFSTSQDQGTTWSSPAIIPQATTGDQFFPWLEVGPDGRLHLVYFDTRYSELPDDEVDALLDVTYATSADGGQSWTELRLTNESFRTGEIFWGPNLSQFVGDYLGLALAGNVAVAAYPKTSASGDLDVYVRRVLSPACSDPAHSLCLGGDRFVVEATWRDFDGNEGRGRVVPFQVEDSGLFFFFGEDNWEVLIKVLDACTFNDRFWVLSAATTNVEYSLTVTDTFTGTVRTYSNPLGVAAPAITDTSAFATCGASTDRPAPSSSNALSAPVSAQPVARSTEAESTCTADDTTMCLTGSRFEVEVEWRDFDDREGPGLVVSGVPADSSGLFQFFGPNNWEVLIKVLDACTFNDRFWVLAAATTNVQYTLRVTDTESGEVLEYFNPLGVAAPAITDTTAFATCP